MFYKFSVPLPIRRSAPRFITHSNIWKRPRASGRAATTTLAVSTLPDKLLIIWPEASLYFWLFDNLATILPILKWATQRNIWIHTWNECNFVVHFSLWNIENIWPCEKLHLLVGHPRRIVLTHGWVMHYGWRLPKTMNRVILLRTVHTREGGGGAEHIFDIDIKHQCLTQHIFASILYILKKGGRGTTYTMSLNIQFIQTDKVHSRTFTDFYQNAFKSIFCNKTNSIL